MCGEHHVAEVIFRSEHRPSDRREFGRLVRELLGSNARLLEAVEEAADDADDTKSD